MTHPIDTSQTPPSEQQPKRPRYLPPETIGSSTPTKPPKLPKRPNSQQSKANSLFSYKSRLGRLSLQASWLLIVLAAIPLTFILIIFMVIGGLLGNISSLTSNPSGLGLVVIVIVAIPIIAILVFTAIFYVRRLHDLDRSGWWLTLSIFLSVVSGIFTWSNLMGASYISGAIDFINGLFFLYLMLAPGTAGINRYGAPRHTPTYEKVLGWISVVLMALILAASWMSPISSPGHSHPTDTTLTTPTSTSTNPTTNAKFSVPYPFTAQQLWTNILKVTALPDGHLTPAQIENAFGTSLLPDSKPITKNTTFKTKSGEDWYFSLIFSTINLLGNNSEIFFFDWKNHATTYGSKPPEGMCINVNEIKPSLLSQGWIAQRQDATNRIQSKVEYVKDKSDLLLAYDSDTKCLKQLTLVVSVKS